MFIYKAARTFQCRSLFQFSVTEAKSLSSPAALSTALHWFMQELWLITSFTTCSTWRFINYHIPLLWSMMPPSMWSHQSSLKWPPLNCWRLLHSMNWLQPGLFQFVSVHFSKQNSTLQNIWQHSGSFMLFSSNSICFWTQSMWLNANLFKMIIFYHLFCFYHAFQN